MQHHIFLLKKSVLFFVIFIVAFMARAEDGNILYARYSSRVVYLRNELYLDPSKAQYPALWARLEGIMKTKLLSNYFPVMTGSAFFVDAQGRMITNRHVAWFESVEVLRKNSAHYIESVINESSSDFDKKEQDLLKSDVKRVFLGSAYRLSALFGSTFLGEVKILALGSIKGADLALLEIPGYKSIPIPLADSDEVQSSLVGSDVFSLGYPLGFSLDSEFKERTVTMNKGNISAYRASDLLDIQHSAAISGGNSGGPLLDGKGKVIGVNAGAYDSRLANSLYYAISAVKIRKFLEDNGFGDILLWNARLAEIDTAKNTGIVTNTAGEIECPSVVVVTVPPSIQVTLDGKKIGKGNQALLLTNPLSNLSLVGSNFTASYKLRFVSAMQGSLTIAPQAEKQLAMINFTSVPSGAVVIVDGNQLGVTPFQTVLPKGSYNVQYALAGIAFPRGTIDVTSSSDITIAASGTTAYPVTFTGLSALTSGTCHFRYGTIEYVQDLGPTVQIPSGKYELEVTGIEGLKDVKIPIEVPQEPSEFNLITYVKTAPLEIRGLTPKATVWVDGVKLPAGNNGFLSLPIDFHTVAVWQKGFYPFLPVKVYVGSEGDAFVTWKHKIGLDAQRSGFLWTGATLTVVGAVCGGLSMYLGQNDYIVSHTNSYDDYTSMKKTMEYFQTGSIVLLSSGLLSTILGIRAGLAFNAQQKELSK